MPPWDPCRAVAVTAVRLCRVPAVEHSTNNMFAECRHHGTRQSICLPSVGILALGKVFVCRRPPSAAPHPRPRPSCQASAAPPATPEIPAGSRGAGHAAGAAGRDPRRWPRRRFHAVVESQVRLHPTPLHLFYFLFYLLINE